MNVVYVNGAVLRTQTCAYWIAENEDEAKKFFDSITSSLPEQSTFSTAILDVDDISSFSLLFNQNYLGFNIIGHGFVYWWQLVERNPEMVEKLSNILRISQTLWCPVNADGKPVTISRISQRLLYPMDTDGEPVAVHLGTAYVIQSFYSRRELAEPYGKPVAVNICTYIDDQQQRPADAALLMLDGETIYGCDFYDGICKSRAAGSESAVFTKERLHQLAEHIKSKYSIPKWDIIAEPMEQDDIFISKIGGFPYYPFDMEYPVGEDGKPLFLLAQIVTGGKEMLQFFIANDDLYGLNYKDQTDTSNFRVVYHDHIDRSVTIDSVRERGIPSSAEAISKAEDKVLLPMSSTVGKIIFKKGADHLSQAMYKHRDVAMAEIALLFGFKVSEIDYDSEEVFWRELMTDGSKLYGLPFFT